MFRKIADFIAKYPVTVVTGALVLFITAIIFGSSIFNHLSQGNFGANGTESAKVSEILDDKFGHTNVSMVVLVGDKSGGKVGSTEFDVNAQKLLEKIKDTDGVYSVNSFYNTGSTTFVSKDNDKTFFAINFDEGVDASKLSTDLQAKLEANIPAGMTLGFSGQAVIENTFNQQIEHDLKRSEIISFAVLAVLLVVVFRSLVAAFIPLLLGGFTIFVSFLLIRVVSSYTPISQYAINIIIALGLGLAIDYSLLIISRFREELDRNKCDKFKALKETIHTAGHTVFFSGLTVVTCLLSLTVFPMDMLKSMGIGGGIAVAVAMISGLIVLPAILVLLGKKINYLAIGRLRKQQSESVKPSSMWRRITDITMKRPIVVTGFVILVLLMAGAPLLDFNISSMSAKSLPQSSPVRQTLDALADDFPSSSTNGLTVIYQASQLTSEQGITELKSYIAKLSQLPDVVSVDSVVSLPGVPKDQISYMLANPDKAPPALRAQIDNYLQGDTTVININRENDLATYQKDALLAAVRVTPPPEGVSVNVGGSDAIARDQIDAVQKSLPYAAAWIALTIFVILFLMLDSVVLPLKAILLNILSLGTALGAMIWIFQDGHLVGLFGFNTEAGVGITQPIIVFVAAFGLSMDYSAFLYGRIKEEYDKLGDTRKAVAYGLAKTGGIITSAALLMFVVVAAFATSKVADIQQIGVGLSIAVLVDAFIVRITLVPASMAILGKYNWWAPKFMKNLHTRLGLDNTKR